MIENITFLNNADDGCLKELSESDPKEKENQGAKGGLLEGPCKWILDHPEYQRWRHEDEH